MRIIRSFLNKMLLGISFLSIMLTHQKVYAVNSEQIKTLESNINRHFHTEINQAGYKGYKIKLDEQATTYAGGVSIEDQYIIFGVGSQAALDYNLSSFNFLSCHELGHIIGGEPYKIGKYPGQYKNMKISTEGQSDYWAGKVCLPKLSNTTIEDALFFFQNMAKNLSDIITDNPFYAPPQIGVPEDRYYEGEYPSFQCRLNTVIAGFYKLDRPSCWYKK